MSRREFDQSMLDDLLSGVASSIARVTTYLHETGEADVQTMMMIDGKHAVTGEAETFAAVAFGSSSAPILRAAYKVAENLQSQDSHAVPMSTVDRVLYMDKDGQEL